MNASHEIRLKADEDRSNAVLVELCAGGIDDVHVAMNCGIARLELNSGMAIGGLTPSAGLVQQAREIFPGEIVAMLRPREGGFCYSQAEFQQMLADARFLVDQGCDGLATGFLCAGGEVDLRRCELLRRQFPDTCLVFHRAFDLVPAPVMAMDALASVGFDRILTSGARPTAWAGRDQLRQLIHLAGSRIEILPGGGIRAAHAMQLVKYLGCRQLHTSARQLRDDPSVMSTCGIHFGGDPPASPGTYGAAAPDVLRQLLEALNAPDKL